MQRNADLLGLAGLAGLARRLASWLANWLASWLAGPRQGNLGGRSTARASILDGKNPKKQPELVKMHA